MSWVWTDELAAILQSAGEQHPMSWTTRPAALRLDDEEVDRLGFARSRLGNAEADGDSLDPDA